MPSKASCPKNHRLNYKTDLAMTREDFTDREVVVSLTSFPPAIGYAVKAIKSILKGSVLPDRIVLYLYLPQFRDSTVPEELTQLQKEYPIFEIRDCESDTRSYKKLVPALRDFPESIIITVDDDVAYHKNMVRDLLRLHAKYPEYIFAHRAKQVMPGFPYKKWTKYRWYHFLFKRIQPSFRNLQTGVGGVLYPPHSLSSEMMDESLFTELAPTCDDIWFWAAAVANGTKVVPVPFGHNKPKGLGKPASISLKTLNFKKSDDRNTAALMAILHRYLNITAKLI